MTSYFKNKKILITGASFIGVHLARKLLNFDPFSIRIVNKTKKHFKYLKKLKKDVEFVNHDLRDINNAKKAVKKIDIVFHLAADHGGRGYVDLFQGKTATNFLLDGSVFKVCLDEGIEKIIYASSGCVYPNYLQSNLKEKRLLKETDVKPPYDADNIYGWAKLIGELTIKKYYKDFGLKSAIGRFFTVYGPYASESHAVIGTIAKAFIKQDPFEIWGNGKQIRNWTYVDDIVEGLIKLAQNIEDSTSVNLGTMERIRVIDMVKMIFEFTNFRPRKIKFMDMPIGPVNRVADNSLAWKKLNWKPRYDFKSGLEKTVKWYFKTKNKNQIKSNINSILLGG